MANEDIERKRKFDEVRKKAAEWKDKVEAEREEAKELEEDVGRPTEFNFVEGKLVPTRMNTSNLFLKADDVGPQVTLENSIRSTPVEDVKKEEKKDELYQTGAYEEFGRQNQTREVTRRTPENPRVEITQRQELGMGMREERRTVGMERTGEIKEDKYYANVEVDRIDSGGMPWEEKKKFRRF